MDRIDIAKQPERYWGYAYLHPRTEKMVARKLRNAGVSCYLPVVPHAYMMHSTKVITEVPMFPGYLFLCLGRFEAADLKIREKKIVKIDLQFDEGREALLIDELHTLQRCEALAKTEPILINPGIRHGDKVLITSGSLAGLVTEVVRRDDAHDAIIVNVTLLGQHIEYRLPAEKLKKLTE